jgi:DNA-binding PadR family transcriptional regulator
VDVGPGAGDLRLSPISYLVLGLVRRRGSGTPYELKQEAASGLGALWPQSHAQLYAEPARLAEHGLLAVSVEESGRRRRYYRITPAGRTCLESWLDEDVVDDLAFRDPALVKLQVLDPDPGSADSARVRTLAQQRAAVRRRRIDGSAARRSDTGSPGAAELQRLAAELDRAAAEYWAALAARLAEPAGMGREPG